MKELLNGDFWPATTSYGFYLLPLDEITAAFDRWWKNLGSLGPGFAVDRFEGGIADALLRLDPVGITSQLPEWYDRHRAMLVETKSDWCAVFIGHPSGPQAAVMHLARTVPCQASQVTCIKDTYDTTTGSGRYGGIIFALHGPESSQDKVIYAVHGTGGWEFHNEGPLLPFERAEHYKARRVKDRLTQELLDEYCGALGIRPFDEDFFGPRGALFYSLDPVPPGFRTVTFEELRRYRS